MQVYKQKLALFLENHKIQHQSTPSKKKKKIWQSIFNNDKRNNKVL